MTLDPVLFEWLKGAMCGVGWGLIVGWFFGARWLWSFMEENEEEEKRPELDEE